jgi:hypothetical protein
VRSKQKKERSKQKEERNKQKEKSSRKEIHATKVGRNPAAAQLGIEWLCNALPLSLHGKTRVPTL